MLRPNLLLAGLLLAGLSSAQTRELSPAQEDSLDALHELRWKQHKAGLTYTDTTYNFQFRIPHWMEEGNERGAIGWIGVMPPYDGYATIGVEVYYKEDHASFDAFKKLMAEDVTVGQPVPWYYHDTCTSKKDLGRYKDFGPTCEVRYGRKYLQRSQYVLAETPTAYLRIEYEATEDTYEMNLPRFHEFMSGFKTTDFKR